MTRAILYAKRNLDKAKTFKKLLAPQEMYVVTSFNATIDTDVWKFFLTHQVNKENLIKFTQVFEDHNPFTVEDVNLLIKNWDLFDTVELHTIS
jgi:hypothetical protein